MKYGVREVTNLTLKAKVDMKIGSAEFKKGQPVLIIDSAKTSTQEGSTTTVYATGGRGDARLIAWDGEKQLTFTVEDALISSIGLSILASAGLYRGKTETEKVHFHMTTQTVAGAESGEINLTEAVGVDGEICETAPLFVMDCEEDGSLTGIIYDGAELVEGSKNILKCVAAKGKKVIVDYYAIKNAKSISEIQITTESLSGYFYVEADTLFRRQVDGYDAAVNITLPNVKVQSNFSIAMSPSGDPSTFTFTMDAFPGYTYFNPTKKVLCVMQVVEEAEGNKAKLESVMTHEDVELVSQNTPDDKEYIKDSIDKVNG